MIKRVGVQGLVKIAIVAAIYIVTTIMFGDLSYGPIQFRVSELLNFLAFIDPFYIIALAIGCAISNLYSFGIIDVFVGTIATILATYAMYKSKNIIIASLWPIINSVFVAAELFFLNIAPFWFSLATIALGEFVVMTVIGVPVFRGVFKNKKFIQMILIDKNNTSYIDKLVDIKENKMC